MKYLNNFINSLVKYITPLYLVILGLFWIILYIYIRLILERNNYSLNDLQGVATPTYLVLQICFLLIHILFLFLAFYTIYNLHYKAMHKKDSNYPKQLPQLWAIKKAKSFSDFLIKKPLIHIKDIISSHTLFLEQYFIIFINFSIKYNLIKHCQIYLIIFYYGPKIIIATIFFVEIIFYHKIYYFFKFLVILIIPICWLIFVELLTDCGLRGVKYIQQYFYIIGHGKIKNDGVNEDGYTLHLKKGFICDPTDLENFKAKWNGVSLLVIIGESYFKAYKEMIDPYVTIICSSLYFIALIYKLIYILF